jgi:hypothetical protein
MSGQSIERREPRRQGRYPSAVRWGWAAVLVIIVAAAAAAWIAVASRGSTNTPPAKPGLAQPADRSGDDADLMRRLERDKLVGKHK